jgi:hypothetical protein
MPKQTGVENVLTKIKNEIIKDREYMEKVRSFGVGNNDCRALTLRWAECRGICIIHQCVQATSSTLHLSTSRLGLWKTCDWLLFVEGKIQKQTMSVVGIRAESMSIFSKQINKALMV